MDAFAELIKAGITPQRDAEIAELRRARAFGSRDSEEDVLYRYGRAGLLVIDEIGRTISQEEERHALYLVVNERYNRRRPTVLVSNLAKVELLNYLGAACADRLSESAVAVEFSGRSFRAELRGAARI